MQITTETTVKNILEAYPDAVHIFQRHGVDVPGECDENILNIRLVICDSMCHVDNLDSLIRDLKQFVANKEG